jgi:hypothetical protein
MLVNVDKPAFARYITATDETLEIVFLFIREFLLLHVGKRV